MQMPASPKVLIARDRREAGGGIFGFFEAITIHLDVEWRLCGVGRRHAFYQNGGKADGRFVSSLRIVADWLRLGFEILRFRPNLVHLNAGLDKEERSLWREAVSVWIASMMGCRVLVFWHGWDHPAAGTAEFPGGNDGWLSRSYRMAAAHVVLASAFREDLQRWGFQGIHLGSTVVPESILNMVETPIDRESPPTVLFLSRVERAKGLWELLEALAILRKRGVRCDLTIAGDGPDLEPLKVHASMLGLNDVSFPGFVTGDAKSDCFQRATIFCFPSHSEGMPLAVLEAMAAGLPVVATPAGGLRDILQDGIHGFLVPLANPSENPFRVSPQGLADKIEKLFLQSDLRLQMGAANRKYARQRFAPQVVARNLEEIYREVVR